MNILKSLCDFLTLQSLTSFLFVLVKGILEFSVRMVKCSFLGKSAVHLGATFLLLISLLSLLAWLTTTEQRFNLQVIKVSLIIQLKLILETVYYNADRKMKDSAWSYGVYFNSNNPERSSERFKIKLLDFVC